MTHAALRQVEVESRSTAQAAPVDRLVQRVRAEFIEQPGLRLTEPQAMRLWRLDHDTTGQVLGALVDETFLRRAPDGRYGRPSTR